jgi:MYXO-CTERM domain-containing protein
VKRLVLVMLAACGTSTTSTEQGITEAVKRERLALIRDSAAQMGAYNAALLAGIAKSETELAHCFSEAGFACPGPASPSCGGEAIIAGGADGPCSAMQGGLGMFQFDAGTFTDTVAMYGDSILTIEGNTAQAVAFVVDKIILDINGVNDWRTATAWMNSVPLVAGDPLTEEWAKLIACRYNGCCSTSTTCTTRARGYRDNAITLYNEMGAEFWRTAERCSAVPEDGIIDQRSACYTAGGEPRYWRREEGGYADSREWTNTTSAAAPSSFAIWKIASAGTYRLEIYISGGEATAAKYEVRHGGTTEIITIDQTTADGFVPLGVFAFAGDGDEYVLLGDNTGTRDQKLVFDALRIVSPDEGGAGGCGCRTNGSPAAAFALFVLASISRRRRRQTAAR